MQGNFRDFFKGKNGSYKAVNIVFVSTGYRHFMTYAIVRFRKVRVGTEYTYGQMHVCRRESSSNPKSNTLQRDRPQHDRPAACYRPAVFFHHHHRIARSLPREKNSAHVPKFLLLRSFNHA